MDRARTGPSSTTGPPTQFVGSPETVAGHLERLQEATGADELIVTTITHGHADRVRSFSLLAQEWMVRGGIAADASEKERIAAIRS